MATKASETTETTENREETGDRPLMDANSAAIKKLIQRAKDRGYITYEELNQILPPDQMSSEQIEDSMAALSEMGITVIESEEQDDSADSEKEEEAPSRATGNLDSVHGQEVMEMLRTLNAEGTTIVMVTHSPAHADYARRTVNLVDGHVVTDAMRAA